MAKRKNKSIHLSEALVLNRYLLSLLGVKDFESLVKDLKASDLEGYDENNVSRLYTELSRQLRRGAVLTRQQLYEYDQRIVSHTLAISKQRAHSIHWKYFQYLALLFTEIYLDRYFRDKTKLLQDLNDFLDAFNDPDNTEVPNKEGAQLQAFCESDLNKLAFWNATGSGKTLLMHINIKQYLYYQKKHTHKPINKILLVTPNEGLSAQHLKEFEVSGIEAEIFSKGMSLTGSPVEVIEISKLAESSGEKTVAVDAFETNNLVLIDEGHRGIAGEQWKQRRDQLSEEGFAFEYSATFGQAVNAASRKDKSVLVEEYSKSVLFDYSYKYFYQDGYGKDYRILNITDSGQADFMRKYLTGSLLAFYQQKRLFHDSLTEAAQFNLENPLWVFVGSSVNAVRTENKEKVSDVLNIIQFFTGFVKDSELSKRDIQEILDGKEGLLNEAGISIFRGTFEYLKTKGLTPEAIYTDILKLVFNTEVTGANVYLDNLGGADGELGLRVGNTESYFGVVNVGDESKLWKLAQSYDIPGVGKDFGSSLFQTINTSDSKVNLLIGAKKFTEGWSSWRVSTMGLMNIGKGEGSQIIQLFGRGVRLKGYQFSLKRSRGLDEFQKPKGAFPPFIQLLETLNIFGIRANYMQRFKEYLEEEGLPPNDSAFESITVPTMPTVSLEDHKLKIIKVKEGMDFRADVPCTLQYEVFWHGNKPVTVDWFPKVQMVSSAGMVKEPEAVPYSRPLTPSQHAFLDWNALYLELHQFKQERGWNNLFFDQVALQDILKHSDWYNLFIPESILSTYSFRQIQTWQEIACALLKGYTERYYNHKKAAYESQHLELRTLSRDHDNYLEEYQILVEQGQTEIIHKLRQLKDVFATVRDHVEDIDQNFTAFSFVRHLYQPLLYIHDKQYRDLVKIAPVALNEGERQFVDDLKDYYANSPDFFADKKLFLLRNRSRKGIGFFEANNFYPDFILWLVIDHYQYIAFIDPKGLRNINGLEHPKIQFYQTIKNTIEHRLDDSAVTLSSFIISNTSFEHVKHWKGQERMSDFNKYNVYFQKEQRYAYVEKVLMKVVDGA